MSQEENPVFDYAKAKAVLDAQTAFETAKETLKSAQKEFLASGSVDVFRDQLKELTGGKAKQFAYVLVKHSDGEEYCAYIKGNAPVAKNGSVDVVFGFWEEAATINVAQIIKVYGNDEEDKAYVAQYQKESDAYDAAQRREEEEAAEAARQKEAEKEARRNGTAKAADAADAPKDADKSAEAPKADAAPADKKDDKAAAAPAADKPADKPATQEAKPNGAAAPAAGTPAIATGNTIKSDDKKDDKPTVQTQGGAVIGGAAAKPAQPARTETKPPVPVAPGAAPAPVK